MKLSTHLHQKFSNRGQKVLLKRLLWSDLKNQRRAHNIFCIINVIQYKAAGTKCHFYGLNTLIKPVLRNERDIEQRPADETAAQALKYYLPNSTGN